MEIKQDFVFENYLDYQYQELLNEIMTQGNKKGDRTGTGTHSLFGRTIRHNMQEGFPLLTTKRVWNKGVLHELLWFLQGNANINYLLDHKVNIWNEWPYFEWFKTLDLPEELKDMRITDFVSKCRKDDEYNKTFYPYTIDFFIANMRANEEFAKKWGHPGRVYGTQWIDMRSWEEVGVSIKPKSVNQIQNMVDLLRKNPDSRRMLVSAWNAADMEGMVLPPCHYAFQMYSVLMTYEERLELFNKEYSKVSDGKVQSTDKEFMEQYFEEYKIPKRKLSMMWHIRSVDTFLGMPFDIASYGYLLSMFAHVTNHMPDELIMVSGDTHLYNNHLEAAREQTMREPYKLPTLRIKRDVSDIFDFKYDDFEIVDYKHHPTIKAEISI